MSGGARPFTRGRAASLASAVLVAIGVLTGLSHVGHSTISTCRGTWFVVVGTATDPSAGPTQASRAAALAPSPCAGTIKSPKGGYEAYFQFETQADAQAYADKLIAAGYPAKWDFTPFVQAPAPPSQ